MSRLIFQANDRQAKAIINKCRVEYPIGRPADLAEEHYVVVGDVKEARFVHSRLMNQEGRNLFKQRMTHLQREGTVSELNMPDTFSALQGHIQEANVALHQEALELQRQIDEMKMVQEGCCP